MHKYLNIQLTYYFCKNGCFPSTAAQCLCMRVAALAAHVAAAVAADAVPAAAAEQE